VTEGRLLEHLLCSLTEVPNTLPATLESTADEEPSSGTIKAGEAETIWVTISADRLLSTAAAGDGGEALRIVRNVAGGVH
jgi:hypothetical protein